MSTLASQLLKLSGPRFSDNVGASKHPKQLRQLQDWTHNFICSRLRAPLLSSDLRVTADQCAERYIFDEDAPLITTQLIDSGAVSADLVWESTRLPASNVWIEFPSNQDNEEGFHTRIGFMLGRVPVNDTVLSNHRMVMALAAMSSDGAGGAVGLITLPDKPVTATNYAVGVHWFYDRTALDRLDNSRIDIQRECRLFVNDMISCLFLINTPRVCELREGIFGPRKPKIQQRLNHPLVEYKRVVLKVGVGAPRYQRNPNPTDETEEARSKRLHRVVGHFRTYRAGREQPKLSFVPQHWRGDATKGILLHERTVKR